MDYARKPRPLWPWIVAVLIGVPVLYVASLPLVFWCWHKGMFPDRLGELYFYPADWLAYQLPKNIRNWYDWYRIILFRL